MLCTPTQAPLPSATKMRPLLGVQVIPNLRASWQDRKDRNLGAEPARPCTYGSIGPNVQSHVQSKPLLHYLKWEP